MTSVNGINTDTTLIKGSVSSPFPDGISADYFGTVTVNGASAVNLGAASYVAGDIVVFGLLTVGGTVGQLPHVITTATGAATIAATASDTSIYTYWGFTPTSQA